jgi:urease accessory protein
LTGDRLPAGELATPGAAPEHALPQVDLVLASDSCGRTWLTRQRAAYPFHVGRLWHVPGDPPGMATLYVQCSSGGIFAGDDLQLCIAALPGAQGHVTSAAATLVHRVDAGLARQRIELRAERDSVLEYLPDPLILFPGARLRSEVDVQIHRDAIVIAADALVPHELGDGRRFALFDGETRIRDEHGRLLARDRLRFNGDLVAAGDPGIFGGWRCQATLFVMQRKVAQAELVARLRAAVAATARAIGGASELPAGCGAWARILAADAAALRAGMLAAWSAARTCLLGVPAPRRRK